MTTQDPLIAPSKMKSLARFVDVNPRPDAGNPILLLDSAAIIASLKNLCLCPRGARGRIFQEDYFSSLYELLQEPLDDITASSISLSLFQIFQKWEPRFDVLPSDIQVFTDHTLPGYRIAVTVRVNGFGTTVSFSALTS